MVAMMKPSVPLSRKFSGTHISSRHESSFCDPAFQALLRKKLSIKEIQTDAPDALLIQ